MLLHIGYHKTGTSWLQRHLFTPACGWAPVDRVIGKEALVYPNPLDWTPEYAHRLMEPALAAVEAPGLVPVLSDERLSGTPHTGGFDSLLVAERLFRTWPGAKVLIVVREQRAMVVSAYRQYIAAVGSASLDAYLDPPRNRKYPMFSWSHFAYDRLVGAYLERFGERRVLVLPYEDYLSDPADYCARIAAFAGASAPPELPWSDRVNPALSALSASVKRRLNPLLLDEFANLGPMVRLPGLHRPSLRALKALDRQLPPALLKRFEQRLKAQVAERVGERYAASNRRLEAMTGLDLQALGYA